MPSYRLKVCAFVTLIAWVGSLAAQPTSDFSSEKILAHVQFLASEELHGRGAGTGDERRAAEYISARLEACNVPPPPNSRRIQEFSYRVAGGEGAVRSVNVLGWIEGADQQLREQILVVGAHFDHLGIAAGKIYPGADDNASGVAALLEMSAALAKNRDRLGRSVAIAFFGAEEVGLIGSTMFVRDCPVDLQRVVAMINIDMIGRPVMDQASWEPLKKLARIDSKNAIAVVGTGAGPLFTTTIEAAARQSDMQVLGTQNIPFLSRVMDTLAQNRSDHAAFQAAGIPSLFFSSGQSADYHRSEDTADKIDGGLLARRAELMRNVLIGLSKAPSEQLPRIRNATTPAGQLVPSLTLSRGSLQVAVKDNAESPQTLSGLKSLFNTVSAPDFNAFDPDSPGASAGLNFEHIIAGHANPNNRFAPRHGRYHLYRIDDSSAMLVRRREDCPWDVSSTLRYTLVAPHFVDFEFRCTPHDRARFGTRGSGIFFFANYMNNVHDPAIHFLGVSTAGGKEDWINADAAPGHADWDHGGTYRALPAPATEYDADHNFRLNSWTYDYPRFTRPFYYGRAANDMVFMLMFDRGYTEADEIRFSLFKFKLPAKSRPAWDFQYVIHRVQENREYGFRGRLAWKKWVSEEDCLREYERFIEQLR